MRFIHDSCKRVWPCHQHFACYDFAWLYACLGPQILAHVPPMQRERVAQVLMAPGYLRKLLDLFRVSRSAAWWSRGCSCGAGSAGSISCSLSPRTGSFEGFACSRVGHLQRRHQGCSQAWGQLTMPWIAKQSPVAAGGVCSCHVHGHVACMWLCMLASFDSLLAVWRCVLTAAM